MVDPSKTVLPTCGLGNPILVEEAYHKLTFSQVGKGGNEASSLRMRFTALKAYIDFLSRRKIYSRMARAQMTSLLEYVEIWSLHFTDMAAQRKTDIRKIKKKILMAPSHFIKYGRSNHVKVLVKQFDNKNATNPAIRFCQNVRNYLICNNCIINGLRASNIIELRVEDVNKVKASNDCPGYFTFTNSRYKTSTIYGEKSSFFPRSYSDI